MKIKNKFGQTLEVNPNHWWNPLDWIDVFKFWLEFRNKKVSFRMGDWKIRHGRILILALIFFTGCRIPQCPPPGAERVNDDEMSCEANSLICDNGTDQTYTNCVKR